MASSQRRQPKQAAEPQKLQQLPSLEELLGLLDPESLEGQLEDRHLESLREVGQDPGLLLWAEDPKELVPEWFPRPPEWSSQQRRQKFEAALQDQLWRDLGGTPSEWPSLSDKQQRQLVARSLVHMVYALEMDWLTTQDL